MKCEWREICGSNIYIYIYRERERERKIMIVNWMRGSDKVLFACRFEFKWGPRFWLSNGGGKLGDSGQPGSYSWDGSMFLNVFGLVGGELVE